MTPARNARVTDRNEEVGEADAALLRAMNDGAHGPAGGRTHVLALRVGIPTAIARRKLCRMEAAGVVRRNARLSAVNDVWWEAAHAR